MGELLADWLASWLAAGLVESAAIPSKRLRVELFLGAISLNLSRTALIKIIHFTLALKAEQC